MRSRIALMSAGAVLALLSPMTTATATVPLATAGSWVGKATTIDGKFNYGKVTFTVSGDTVKSFTIEGFTSSCGLTTLFMDPMKIKGNRIAGAYQPVKGADQVVTVRGTFTSKGLSGNFTAGPLCTGEGIFTAKPR